MAVSTGKPVTSAPVRGGAVERVVSHVRTGIQNGRYAPGYRLVEADLTHELGVSRGPVREGLRRLSAEGLVEMVPNRGAIVRRLTLREATELYQLRSVLEALAVALAAENIKNGDNRARFKRAVERIWSDAPRLSTAAYIEENNIFHQAIVDFCGNEQLAKVFHQLQIPLILFQTIQSGGILDARAIAHSVKEHRRIAKLILEGKAKAAEAEMRQHLENASQILRDLPTSVFRSAS